MHSDSKKLRSFLALLFSAGDVRRSQRQVTDYKEEKIDGAEKIRYRVYR